MGRPDGATIGDHQTAARDVAARMAEAYDAAERGDYPAALAIWGPLAQSGVARAQNNVGACFAEGLGVARDPELALRWLTLAAEAGDPVARRNLAALYFKGEGVAQDHTRAAELYRAAAKVGDAPAQDTLSWMLLEGETAPFDASEARRWALAAAEQGVAPAMTRLGMIYHNALGVDRDPATAATWWAKAAARGDARRPSHVGSRPPPWRGRAARRRCRARLVAPLKRLRQRARRSVSEQCPQCIDG